MTQDNAKDSGQSLNKTQRLAAYRKKLRNLKERSSLREVTEREFLMEFIRVNHGNINEFPLLAAQQNSVIALMCNRGRHPGYDYIQKVSNAFMVAVSRHEKAELSGDTDSLPKLAAELQRTEGLLVKTVQGIVYAMALITDNFEEMVLRYFGQGSLREYSSLIEEYELDHRFWNAFMEQFVSSRVHEAFKEMVDNKRYDLSKESKFLVLRFMLDEVLAKLNPTTKKIEKTRIQKMYELTDAGFKERRKAKLVQNSLTKGLQDYMPESETREKDYVNTARIVCMDPVAQEFADAYVKRVMESKSGNEKGTREERKQRDEDFRFLYDQIMSVGVGAALAIGITAQNLFQALEKFIPGETKRIEPLARNFNSSALEHVLFFVLEHHFMYILRDRASGEGGKVTVRSARAKRVAQKDVDALAELGLGKLRRSKLFGRDTTREGMLLFKPRTASQLMEIVKQLQISGELLEKIRELWTGGGLRIDIMVLVNLPQVARTTTNLKNRLGEILALYGVGGSEENGAEAAPAPSE
ncbi:hypothetical protein [Desulfovibrio oxyclinae]|jgi:hypothetical protein|uniref:hypothetical protein n=1 Tax=Desulfovibrio oxyclinae TaxID=63560 RepID=UPI00036251F8|nr:hypothetical protein [Desulfovibrio oxyclinae]